MKSLLLLCSLVTLAGCSLDSPSGTQEVSNSSVNNDPAATPPDLIVTAKPPAVTATPSATFSFGSTDPDATFFCSLNGAVLSSCINPTALNVAMTGSQNFIIRSFKNNLWSEPSSHTWTYNPSAISSQIMTTPQPFTNSASLSISFSGTYAAGLAALECRLDNEAFQTCTSPRLVSAPAEGAHQFFVRAVGSDGARSAPASVSWTRDITKPAVAVSGTAIPNTEGWLVTFNLSATDAGGIKRRTCQVNGGAVFVCQSVHQVQIGSAENFIAVLNFWAEDNAGNIEQGTRGFNGQDGNNGFFY